MRISDWSSDVCSSDLLSLVDVRAGLEGYGDRRRAIGVAGRRHIEQALYAIQLLLDHLSDILLQRRRFRPGICRPDREGRGRNRWILRSEEHTSELQSLMRISNAVFSLKKKSTIIK